MEERASSAADAVECRVAFMSTNGMKALSARCLRDVSLRRSMIRPQ
jgi:hypothetical protein